MANGKVSPAVSPIEETSPGITHDHGYAVYNYQITTRARGDSSDDPSVLNAIEENTEVKERENSLTPRVTEVALKCRLSLLSSNLQAEQETQLRSFAAKRLDRIPPLEGSSNIASLASGTVFNGHSMLYYYLLRENKEGSSNGEDESGNSRREECNFKKNFLVCFVVKIDSGLDFFQTELDKYCQSLGPHLDKYMESVDVSEYLRLLESWFDVNVLFIIRCMDTLGDQLSGVLFASFIGEEVSTSNLPEKVKQDFEKFIGCCTLLELLKDSNGKSEEILLSSPTSPTTMSKGSSEILFNNEVYTVSNLRTTQFCCDCIKTMKQVNGNPFKLRQIVENYKSKVIQDMNTFKRLTRQAETDYYALYRSYAFLISCDNGEILLKNAKRQCAEESSQSTEEILRVIDEYIQENESFSAQQKEGDTKEKLQYLLKTLGH